MASVKKTRRAHAQTSLAFVSASDWLAGDKEEDMAAGGGMDGVEGRSHKLKRQQQLVRRLKQKTSAFMHDRRRTGVFTDLVSHLQSHSPAKLVVTMKFVRKIYHHLLSENLMALKDSSTPSSTDEAAEKQFRLWLQNNFKESKKILLNLIRHEARSVQVSAIQTLLSLVQWEKQKPLKSPTKSETEIRDIVGICLAEENVGSVIEQFEKYCKDDETASVVLKSLRSLLNDRMKWKTTESLLTNVLSFLEMFLRLPSVREDDDGRTQESDSKKICFRHKQELCKTWKIYLSFKLSASLYKRVLLLLPNKILPLFEDPRVLVDFLTESCNVGGLVSLLALNGLFVLIKDYNLEFPQFYVRLYDLCSPDMFFVKFRNRFLKLLYTALCSTHLPEYLINSFVKKLSRLALVGPVDGTSEILLLLSKIMDHPYDTILPYDAISSSDPYIETEKDPSQCRATSSSLWEIEALQSHYYSSIASRISKTKLAKSFSYEDDDSNEDLINQELTTELTSCSLNVVSSSRTFDQTEGILQNLWVYT